jgi:MFS family permease
VVDVVGEARRHAASGGAPERVADDRSRLFAEMKVVLRDVERVLRAVEELRDRVRDLGGLLPAVAQRADLDALAQVVSSTRACFNRRVSPVRRNALVLAAGLVFQSGMIQLAVALGTVTIVTVTGVDSILGLGPAVFLIAGALAVGPAGRISDRLGRMPVIRSGFVLGIAGPLVTAAGCAWGSAVLVFLGLGLCGAAQSIVLLSRAAAAEMFPPERRARGMSIVLFGVVSGAIWGPVVFGPMFSGRTLTAKDLVVPWIAAGAFTTAGLALSFLVRPDPKTIGATYATPAEAAAPAAPLREILGRPGVATAMVAAVASFAVMTGVMNLAGYVAVGHHHRNGDVFTIISLHIVGMYGFVLVAGDLIERIGRRRSMVIGLCVMAVSNAGLAWFASIAGMSLSLFGLGLGWCLAYIAATTELVDRATASERGRLVGLTDLLSSFSGAALALSGGIVYTGAGGSVTLAVAACGLAFLAAAWVAGNGPVLLPSAAADA